MRLRLTDAANASVRLACLPNAESSGNASATVNRGAAGKRGSTGVSQVTDSALPGASTCVNSESVYSTFFTPVCLKSVSNTPALSATQ